MLNQETLKRLMIAGGILLLAIVFTLGYGIGQIGTKTSQIPKETKGVSLLPDKADVPLTQEKVEEFLMVYFTKKDLGENRNRYKPFMTESMYNQQIAFEEDPTNKTYKGYVVDYKYDKATIYIDDTAKKAMVTVKYTNTLLAEIGQEEGAQKNVMNTANYLLTYTITPTGKLLVSQIDPILVFDQNGAINQTITLP